MSEACNEDGAVRLAGSLGVNRTEGRLEICASGFWGTVCNDGFDTNAAKVVCRQLGFPENGELLRVPIDIVYKKNLRFRLIILRNFQNNIIRVSPTF